jgi:cytoplasmic iron level regulating protein YaaA (DUF328/UPF0246 family)
MKIILSPAKSLDFDLAPHSDTSQLPYFIKEADVLMKKMKKLSPKTIGELMDVSSTIAELNYNRFQAWQVPFPVELAKPAIYVFTGEAYRGLDVNSLAANEIKIAEEKLRILSGLYGLLRPMDVILPYRLEMGTSYAFTSKANNLYQFWQTKIANHLANEMEKDEVLVNVASNEYSKVLHLNKFPRKVITCHFKEEKNGDLKTIMTFAKKARGSMARFIIQNNIEKPTHLKGFDTEGYLFNSHLSTETDFVFTR